MIIENFIDIWSEKFIDLTNFFLDYWKLKILLIWQKFIDKWSVRLLWTKCRVRLKVQTCSKPRFKKYMFGTCLFFYCINTKRCNEKGKKSVAKTIKNHNINCYISGMGGGIQLRIRVANVSNNLVLFKFMSLHT